MQENGCHFRSTDEIAVLVRSFECCTLPHSEWNHRAHLVIAAYYLSQLPETEATQRVITGIQRYNHAKGIPMTPHGGYHETLTLFWLGITRRYLTTLDPSDSLLQRVNRFVHAYGDQKQLFFEYYSHETIMSCRARQTWVEPDLKALD